MTSTSIEDRLRRLEDIFEIQQLRNSYSYFSNVDGSPPRVRQFADNFVEDAEFNAGFGVMSGREGIFEGVGLASQYWGRFLHLTMNGTLEIDDDEAKGRWTGLFPFTMKGASQLSWGATYYSDIYVRTAEGWKFKSVFANSVFFDSNWHQTFPNYLELNPDCIVINN